MSWKMPNVGVITVTSTVMLLVTVGTVLTGVATTEHQQDFDSGYDGRIKSLNMDLIKLSVLKKLGMQRPPELGDRLLLEDHAGKYNSDSGSYTVAPSQIRVKSNHIHSIGNGDTDMQSRKSASASTDNTINSYNVRDDEDDDDYHVKTQKLIAFAQSHPTVQNVQGQYPLYFTFSKRIQHYRITKAILWVYKRRLDVVMDNSVVIIDVYRINPINLQQSLVSSIKRVLNTTEPSWVPIEVQSSTSDWFKTVGEVKNLTLMVQAYYLNMNTTHDKLPYIIDSRKRDDNITVIPYLEMHTHNGYRNRRGAESEQRTYSDTTAHTQCSRHSVTIDLKELGWKQIIWPEKLEFYYCSGECSSTMPVQSSSVRETHQCCVPRKTSNLSTLYFDYTGPSLIRRSEVSDIIVDECGCQGADSIVRSLLKRQRFL